MRRHHLLLALLFCSSVALAEPAPLTGTVTYESRLITHDGIEKRTRFSERLVRTATDVWTERVIPAEAAHAHDESHDHLHPADLSRAARHLSLDADGQLHLRFVVEDQHTVVNAEPRDFAQLGFDGKWPASWSLFDPALLKNLQKSKRKTTEAGAIWYETRSQGRFLRVLWSQPHQLALEIVSGNDDGNRWNRTQVRLDPRQSATLPWRRLTDYQQKDYVDLLD